MGEFVAEGFKSGVLKDTAGLKGTAEGLRVRSSGGKLQVTDGPFTEAKEVVGGLVIIDAADMDEAVRIASLHPAAHIGDGIGWGVEVRPIADGCHQ